MTNWPKFIGSDATNALLTYRGSSSSLASNFDLTTGFVYGTSGRAACLMTFLSPESDDLTDIWFFITSYTGTWGSTDGNLNWQIREGLNGSNILGPNLVDAGVYSTGGITGWHRISGLSVSLTAGKLYHVIIFDSDGGGTNYATIRTRLGGQDLFQPFSQNTATTTNGWSSAGTVTSGGLSCCIKIGADTYFSGQIWDSIATVTTGTYERGLYFEPTESCVFIGFALSTDTGQLVNSANTLKLYSASENPGGAALASFSAQGITSGTAPIPSSLILPKASWVDLTAGDGYRVVIAPSANITIPRKCTLSGSPDSTLLAAAMPMGGNYYWTEESGGSWVDDTDAICLLGPILVPNTDSAGGGGLYLPRGMRGGFQ